MTYLSEWTREGQRARNTIAGNRATENNDIVNALSIDVEDYFHVAGFAQRIAPSEWPRFSPRVVSNTQRLLDIFERARVRATFFVLGWVAERFPEIVKEIDRAGHEVACHGYSHRLIYNQHPEQFRRETRYAKELLEKIVQHEVCGYRAASYSITRRSLWALDILIDEGFQYDSSIVPVFHDRYGIRGSPPEPHIIERSHGEIAEFPPSTMRMWNTRVAVAGGGYFRLYPYWITQWILRKINGQGRPFIFYLHPWEIDPDQPRLPATPGARFRHYLNLKRCERRFQRLVNDFQFEPVSQVLERLELGAYTNTSLQGTIAGSG